MKTLLTPYLLGFLIEKGFTYCLARTLTESNSDAYLELTLSPVKIKPDLENLPLEYDTFFKITREPMQMANGIDDTVVYVNLD